MRERLRESSRQGGVLTLDRLQVGCNGKDRVEAHKRPRGGCRADKIDVSIRNQVLGARQRIGERLGPPRINTAIAEESFEKADAAVRGSVVSPLNDDRPLHPERFRHAHARLTRRRGIRRDTHERGLGAQGRHGLVEGWSGADGNRHHCRARIAREDAPTDCSKCVAGRQDGNTPVPPTGDNDTTHRAATRVSRSASARIAAFRSEIDCDSSSE